MPKRFTLAEAQGLIPKVGRLLREAIGRKAEYDDAERAIQSFHERVMVMGGVTVDRDKVLEARNRRDTAAGNLAIVHPTRSRTAAAWSRIWIPA